MSYSNNISYSKEIIQLHNTDCIQNDDLWCNSINNYDGSNWILINYFGGLCNLPYPLLCFHPICCTGFDRFIVGGYVCVGGEYN